MCGLFGFVKSGSEALESREVEAGGRALDSLSHRGPDNSSQLIWRNVFMGHRRLSILDLSDDGTQPLEDRDKRVAVTVNGEIYNYRELRRELGRNNFVSGSDSEVLVHGFLHSGIEASVKEFDGMFAFALLDKENGKVFLGRDRVGIKPLYYGRLGSYFVWSSELKAIKTFFDNLGIKLERDETAIFDALTYRYIPAPKSLYRNIGKLLPAHLVESSLSDSTARSWRFWKAETEITVTDPSAAQNQLKSAIQRSVTMQMVSDVPLGIFLSGGIDSSIVTACGASGRTRVSTFTVGFPEDPDRDETAYAKAVASRYDTNYFYRNMMGNDQRNWQSFLAELYDEPFADPSAVPTYELNKLAREQVTVALAGDGGDELFGGYKWYKRYNTWQRYWRIAQRLGLGGRNLRFSRPPKSSFEKITNRLAILRSTEELALYQVLLPGLLASEREWCREELEIPKDYDDYWAFRRYWRPELGSYRALQYLDFHSFLPDDILVKVDRASMAHSLEVRVPLLGNEVVDLAFKMSEEVIYGPNKVGKHVLKEAFRNDLPDAVLSHKKQGFSPPTSKWRNQIIGSNASLQEAMVRHFIASA